MLSYIKGTVASIGAASAVIDCNNMGYEIIASSKCLDTLNVGAEIKLQTLLVVREDSLTLYGFCDAAEKEMFSMLTTVSGIGPKLAIAVLGGIDAAALANCIASQNTAALSGIKGVGKKTAERILLELKGKIKADSMVVGHLSATEGSTDEDAVLALMSLGYSSSEATSALSRIEGKERMTTEEIIVAALRS
ncbi:MAG: Holliday junction branch migration protein RuvA [Clostridia bacterium]|nr:Holliday junction branch migration protein RuvA [Clostridia bacterium]